MFIERLVFQSKYGSDLVPTLKEGNKLLARHRFGRGRILTDTTGQMFTVVWEFRVRDLSRWDKARKAIFADPAFQRWFQEMAEVVESGHREFYNVEEE